MGIEVKDELLNLVDYIVAQEKNQVVLDHTLLRNEVMSILIDLKSQEETDKYVKSKTIPGIDYELEELLTEVMSEYASSINSVNCSKCISEDDFPVVVRVMSERIHSRAVQHESFNRSKK
jgi:hypothetical protein